jgi:hypothetical protein
VWVLPVAAGQVLEKIEGRRRQWCFPIGVQPVDGLGVVEVALPLAPEKAVAGEADRLAVRAGQAAAVELEAAVFSDRAGFGGEEAREAKQQGGGTVHSDEHCWQAGPRLVKGNCREIVSLIARMGCPRGRGFAPR